MKLALLSDKKQSENLLDNTSQAQVISSEQTDKGE
jgi:hypothetical protein